jgi:ABC-2 type transport system ATP-binding protein
VLLTSHYMADVTALCRRVIVIHHGKLLYDGPLADLASRIAPFKLLSVDLEGGRAPESPERYGTVESLEGGKLTLRVPKDEAPAITARLLAELPVIDLTVEDPPIESVIEHVFRDGTGDGDATPDVPALVGAGSQ